MEERTIDNVAFEHLPKLGGHGKSKIFIIIVVAIVILFGAYWLYQKAHIQKETIPLPQGAAMTPTSHPIPETSKNNLSTIEAELSATTIPDYSSLF